MSSQCLLSNQIKKPKTNINFILDAVTGFIVNFITFGSYAVIGAIVTSGALLILSAALKSTLLLAASIVILTNPYVIAALLIAVALVVAYNTLKEVFQKIDKAYPLESNPSCPDSGDNGLFKIFSSFFDKPKSSRQPNPAANAEELHNAL